MKRYLLDTDILIYWMNGNQRTINRAIQAGRANVTYAIISRAELYFGAYNSNRLQDNLDAIERLTQSLIAPLPFDEAAAHQFGQLKAALKKQGKLIMDADLMIAAIALANNLTLVTNNTKHFARISGLNLENWSS